MAKAKKLPSGSWRTQACYTDSFGKKIVKSFTADTKDKSELMAKQFLVTKEENTNESLTFKEARDYYIEIKENVLSPSTIRGYKQTNGYFDDIDNIKLRDLSQDKIQKWANDFSVDHSPKTVRNAHVLISSILKTFIPGTKLSTTLPQREIKKVFVPTDDYVNSIIKYFKDCKDTDMVNAILLAAYGPCRRSEICGLTSDDINGNVIHIHNSVVLSSEKEYIKKNKAKTSSSDRYIDFPSFVISSLPTSGNIVNLSPDVITHRYINAIDKLNLQHSRFHDLRHYSASVMHAIGVPDQYIMKRGGWSSDFVLKAVYRGTISDYDKKFMEQTNKYFERVHTKVHTSNEKR